MSQEISLRAKNALNSAGAAFLTLSIMALWITNGQFRHVIDLIPMFLLISSVALFFGCFINATSLRWSILAGGLYGFAAAIAIVLFVLSRI